MLLYYYHFFTVSDVGNTERTPAENAPVVQHDLSSSPPVRGQEEKKSANMPARGPGKDIKVVLEHLEKKATSPASSESTLPAGSDQSTEHSEDC